MKIAIISRGKPTSKYPLNGIFEYDQAKALAKKGLKVAFISIDFRAISFKRRYGLFQYDSDGVHVFELSLPLGIYRRCLPLLQRLLLLPFHAMLKSFGKPDIVHAHFYSIAAIAAILKEKYGIPFIVTEHSSKLNKKRSQISALDQKLAQKAFSSCDRLICVSPSLKEHIKANFGIDGICIRNMVDSSCFHYQPIEHKFSPFVYVSVGNLIPLKRFDKLIEAFSTVSKDGQLVIIGDGPERKALQDLVKAKGLDDKVTLKGQLERERIAEVFQGCHVFVLASSSETFGVSCIEALYSGLPVIVTKCGGPESFMNERFGMLVPIDDVAALAEAMKIIRDRYKEYNPGCISKECLESFAPEIVSDEIIEVYNSYTPIQ